QILRRERDTVERPDFAASHQRGLGTTRGFPGLVRGHRDESVHGRLERLDSSEYGVDDLDGREALRADLPGEGERVGVDHGLAPLPCHSLENRSFLSADAANTSID